MWCYIGKADNSWELFTELADGTKLPGSDCVRDVHAYTCRLCAAICRQCATKCERFRHEPLMEACAQSCRRCAEACESLSRSAMSCRVYFVQISISAVNRCMPAIKALHCSMLALVNTTASNSHQDVLTTECLLPSDRMETSSFQFFKYLAAAAANVFTFFSFFCGAVLASRVERPSIGSRVVVGYG